MKKFTSATVGNYYARTDSGKSAVNVKQTKTNRFNEIAFRQHVWHVFCLEMFVAALQILNAGKGEQLTEIGTIV